MTLREANEIHIALLMKEDVDLSILEIKSMVKVPSLNDNEIYAISPEFKDVYIVNVCRNNEGEIESIEVKKIQF